MVCWGGSPALGGKLVGEAVVQVDGRKQHLETQAEEELAVP